MATNKQIVERLECIEARLPNGELQEIHENVKEIKEILLDPEDGIIVRVNKNTYWRIEKSNQFNLFLCLLKKSSLWKHQDFSIANYLNIPLWRLHGLSTSPHALIQNQYQTQIEIIPLF